MVSNIFNFHPYLGKIPILTNIFQLGWNHQPDQIYDDLWIFGLSTAHLGQASALGAAALPPLQRLYVPWPCIEGKKLASSRVHQKEQLGIEVLVQ